MRARAQQVLSGVPTLERRLATVERDRRRGAGELAELVLRGLGAVRPRAGAPKHRVVTELRRLLADAAHLRPSMAPVGNVPRRVAAEFERRLARSRGRDPFLAYAAAISGVENLFATRHADVTGQFKRHFPRLERVVTISYSSQVADALGAPRRKRLWVTVCEARPGLEGRTLARKLAGRAGTVELITEAQIMLAVAEADAVVLGCDTIESDGSVRNKVGSHSLALAARRSGASVIVLADRFKFRIGKEPGEEHHPTSEVWRGAPRKVRVLNPYFEVIPARLIDAVVLEDGVYVPKRLPALRRRELERYV